MISLDVQSLKKDLLKHRENMVKRLENVAKDFSIAVAYIAVDESPYGDSEKYANWYQSRQKTSGYLPVEGLAKGSWTISIGSQENSGAGFYQEPTGESAKEAASLRIEGYKLGQDVYIQNSINYIGILNDGYSPQAPDGIIKPTLNQLENVYAINIQASFKKPV